ncbi:MAG: hypothetical protein FWF49_05260 [Oscillospiraceae bacterium]|nr:hypothetical protein [Oscillospiraceae bacterium]
MNPLITACNNFLKDPGFEYAFCGGHALDIYLKRTMRPHGDIDISVYQQDRDKIISFMQSRDWTVYEAMGGGMVHLINNTADQKQIKRNIFCVRDGCPFFHVEFAEDNMYHCEIGHMEQKELDYIEFLFNNRIENEFIYARNGAIRRKLSQAILCEDDIAYLAPELVLLYKSTDLSRKENCQDFDIVTPYLSDESREWLRNALQTEFPDGHDWLARLV